MPPLAPPKGMLTSAVFQVMSEPGPGVVRVDRGMKAQPALGRAARGIVLEAVSVEDRQSPLSRSIGTVT